MSEDAADLAAAVVRALAAAGLTVGVAESLTGGLVAAELVGVPGASAVLRGGVVAYATDLKGSLLGVPADLLAARGAVDPDVAAAMAAGVRTLLGSDVGVATTGVAGPTPQEGRAPGTFHVAVVAADGVRVRSGAAAPGTAPSRAQVRADARDAALALLHEVLAGGNTGGRPRVPPT